MITKLFTNKGRFIKSFLFMTAIVFFAVGPVGMNSASADINDLLPNNDGQISSQFLKIEEKGITNNGFNIQINIMPQLKTSPKDSNSDGKVDISDNLGDFWSLIASVNDTSGSGYSSGSMTGVFVSVIDKKTNEPVNFTVSSMNSNGFVTDILNKITNKYLKSSQNITEGFWQDTSLFFDQEAFATQVGISGLAADNEYLVQVFIVEKGLLTGGTSWSDELTSEEKLTIKTTKKATSVQINQTTQTTQAVGLSNKQNDICSSIKPSLGIINWEGFYCQMIKVIVEIITFIPNAIAAITGSLADYVMNISIGHGTYQLFEDTMFSGWKVIRDISNLIIIFSLFVAAFTLILGWGNDDGPEMVRSNIGDPKKIIGRAIMVAIFINFSFFFCRVLIDAGNVSGRFIYNQIGTTGDLGGGSKLIKGFVDSQSSDVKNISLAMLSQVQPQKLLISDQSTSTAELGLGLTHAYLVTGFMVLIFDVILIYIFLIMLFLFMGRIVFLSLSTILSPLAFASAIIPGLAKQKYIGFEDWLKNMVGNAFVGTVFFFFIYLSILFSNIDITPLGTGSYGTGFIGLVVGMLFKVSLIFGVLFFGKKIAVDIAGVVGEMAVSVAGKIGGMATGSVVGGAALLARQTIGARGARMADDENLEARVAKGGISGWAAQRQINFGKKLASSDYDVRNVKFGGKTLNERTAAGGYDMNSAMKSTGKGFYGDVEKAKQGAEEAAARAKPRQFSREKLAQDQAKRELEIHNKMMEKDPHGVADELKKRKDAMEEAEKVFNRTPVAKELSTLENDSKMYIEETKAEFDDLETEVNNTSKEIGEITKTLSDAEKKLANKAVKEFVKAQKKLRDAEDKLLRNPADPTAQTQKQQAEAIITAKKRELNALDPELGRKTQKHADTATDSRYRQIKNERENRKNAVNSVKKRADYRAERKKVEDKKTAYRTYEFDWKHSDRALQQANTALQKAETDLVAAEAAYQADRNNVQKQQAFLTAQATQVTAKKAQTKANDYEKLKEKGKVLEESHKKVSKDVEKREKKLRQEHLTRYQSSFGFNMLHNDAQQIAGDTIRRLNNPDNK